MKEQLRTVPEGVVRIVVSPVRQFIDALRAYKEDRVEVFNVDGKDIFGEHNARAFESWRRVRFGGPIGDFLSRGRSTRIIYEASEVPDIIKRHQQSKGIKV